MAIKLPSLEELTERYTLNFKLSGRSESIVDSRIEKLREDYFNYTKVINFSSEGKGYIEIANLTGISRGTIHSWINGRRIPYTIASVVRGYHARKVKYFEPPSTENEGFAYIIGYFLGNIRGKNHVKNKLVHPGGDFAVLSRLKDYIKVTFGEKTGVNRNLFRSVNVFRYLFNITENNSRLPWEHIATRNEKIAFISGFFDARIRLQNYNSDELNVVGKVSLLEQVVTLLGDLKIYPYIRYELKNLSLIFSNFYYLKKLLEYNLVVGKNAGLVKRLIKERMSLPDSSLEAYSRFRTSKDNKVGNRIILKNLIKDYHIPSATAQGWIYKGTVPIIIKNYDLIIKLQNKYHYRNNVNYLYREMGIRLPPKELDELAKNYKDTEKLKYLHRGFIIRKIPTENYLESIYSNIRGTAIVTDRRLELPKIRPEIISTRTTVTRKKVKEVKSLEIKAEPLTKPVENFKLPGDAPVNVDKSAIGRPNPEKAKKSTNKIHGSGVNLL